MHEVLSLQKLLITNFISNPLKHKELHTNFQEQGFLIVQYSHQELRQRLIEGCNILTARQQGKLVGYILLSGPDRLFKWIREKAQKLEIFSQLTLDEMEHVHRDVKQAKVLTQIAVDRSFKKQGIGRQLVNYAKKLAPALLTSIAYKPVTNQASLTFFSKQGFLPIAKAYVRGSGSRGGLDEALEEVYIEFWEQNLRAAS